MITARVVEDSYWVRPDGKRRRLTTMVWRYPRFIHSEIMTHRMLSRNAASSRAIPVTKMMQQVREDPARPVWWGKNQPGMQAHEELSGEERKRAELAWDVARFDALASAQQLVALNAHKQIANRLLEPWMWMVVVVSGTDWGNLYHLRRHPAAQPEFQRLADTSFVAHSNSTPVQLLEGDWHLPFVHRSDIPKYGIEVCRKLSAARCARVSYLNHDGSEPNVEKDIDLHDKLITAPHASPFEHVATPKMGRWGNFNDFMQYRQLIPNENYPSYDGLDYIDL